MDSSKSPPTSTYPAPTRDHSFDLYDEITRQIIDMLDKGVVPWRSPILGRTSVGFPKNLESGKPYRGVNVFLLAFTAFAKGFESAYWLTFNQAKARGGSIKKGEKSAMVVFWKKMEVKDRETNEPKEILVARYYSVFNVTQCSGIKPPDIVTFTPTAFDPVAEAEKIVQGYADGPKIKYGGAKAYYRPVKDTIHIPEPTRFVSPGEFYSTLFHELSHSSGAQSRLNREFATNPKAFGTPDYGKEELIAEMSASFLCAQVGIAPAVIENQASYISGWLGQLKQEANKKLIIHAAAAGQRSTDWIRGIRQADGSEPVPSAPIETEVEGV